MNNNEDDEAGYKWEVAYAEGLNIRTALQEDESGSIENSVRRIILEAKQQRRLLERPSKIRLGIMRYVYLVVDVSMAMLNQTLYPTRFQVTITCLNDFLNKFFEQNPISQLGVILCRDKKAERLIGFSSSPQAIKKALEGIKATYCSGEFSLRNGLLMASQSFLGLPSHSSKEIICIIGSLTTIDSGNLLATFETLKSNSVRGSIIGMGGELYVYKRFCTVTGGTYGVVLDKNHYELLLNDHVQPPIAAPDQAASLIKMGFPQRRIIETPSFCMCYQSRFTSTQNCTEDVSSQHEAKKQQNRRAFFCPQCGAHYCQTPVKCRVCDLLLLTAPQLARAHQHLLPLAAFGEVLPDKEKFCFGCNRTLIMEQKAYACKKCLEEFCIDCDILLHESLHICPACG